MDDNSPAITVAILGVSLVEYELEKILRNRSHHKDDDTWMEVTSINGPLSGLHAKIIAGYAFGLYGSFFKDLLHTLRNVRNAFAHSKKLVDFQNEVILKTLRDVRNLDKSKKKNSELSKGVKYVSEKASGQNPEGKDAFVNLIYVILLHFRKLETKSLKRQVVRLKTKLARVTANKSPNRGFPFSGSSRSHLG